MSVQRDDSAGGGHHDRDRYAEKIRDRLKKALPTIAGQAPIITGNDHDRLTVPIADGDLALPRYRPTLPTDPMPGIGQGTGNAGDRVAAVPKPASSGSGSGSPSAGDSDHQVLIDLSIEELRQLIIDDLHLPPLPPKQPATLTEPDIRWTSRSRHGPQSQVDARASLKQAILRSQAQHQPLSFTPDDLRYRSWTESPREMTQAVIYLLRDVSGSMTDDKRYLSQAAAMYLVLGIQRQYPRCPVHFWVHTDTGQETDELTFYHLDSGGSTAFAPAYRAMQADMDAHYPAAQWNRIVVQFSDGDLWDADAAGSVLAEWLLTLHFFGLVLTAPSAYAGAARVREWTAAFAAPFAIVTLAHRADILGSLRRLLEGGDRS